MAASIQLYADLAAVADPVERQNIADLIASFEELPKERGCTVPAMKEAAGRLGVSFGTFRRKYYAYMERGALALVNQAKQAKPVARHSWESVYMTYCENDLNTSANGYRRMMADFRSGKTLPGVGTWRDCWAIEHPFEKMPVRCPADYVPQGASYANLQKAVKKNPDYLFDIAASRKGRKAAQAYLLPVLKTRLGLPVGAMSEYDDVWHNTDVLMPGQPKAVQPLEFAGYDVASGFKRSSLVKPRFERADGVRDNLKEQQFRFLFAFDHIVTGFHRDGITDIVEHGTTAIREKVRRQIASIPGYGQLINITDSGILSEQVHGGLFIGNGGGNFRMKALCEGAHNIMHNRLASLQGSRGRDAEHMHESRDALVKYEERLALAATKIDPELAAYLEAGLMTFDQYMVAFKTIEAALMDDPEHRLEGWAGNNVAEYRIGDSEWQPAGGLLDMGDDQRGAIAAYLSAHPECKRLRPMSRRECWKAGQADLIRVPDWEMPMFLDADKDAKELVVRDNGLIGFRDDMFYGRDEMLYIAGQLRTREGYIQPLPPRTRVLAFYNPLLSDKIWLVSKEDGRQLGTCPIYQRAPMYDRHAIEVAMGDQSHDLASKILPVRGRHMQETIDRAERLANNARILSGATVSKMEQVGQIGPMKPATIAEITPQNHDDLADEDDADQVAAFLASITPKENQ